jgi:glutamyl-tRNA synthetase
MIKTRFAPSPTGLLHIGNLRIALVSWFYARSQNGKFILRIDNTDQERSKDEYIKKIEEALNWLGLNWDESFEQLDRMPNYNAAKEKLIATGRLYPCYETETELDIKKKELIKQGLPPIYDRAALNLSENGQKKLAESGVRPHWRFLLKDELISWEDKVRGNIKFEAKKLSDPVLIRENGTLTYSLASVVDDIDYNITDIIRGEDHITNSALHIQLFQALDAKAPNFSHISLTKAKDMKLSKRFSSGSLSDLRKKDILPQTILNYLAKKGSSDPLNSLKDIQELIEEFSLKKLSKSPIIYDEKDLHKLNEKAIHTASFKLIKPILDSHKDHAITEEFWLSVRDNLSSIKEVFDWWDICTKNIPTKITNHELIKIAAQTIPTEDFGPDSWSRWINNIKNQTHLRGKDLFIPLRLAITGKKHGPELAKILPYISKKLLFSRFSQ